MIKKWRERSGIVFVMAVVMMLIFLNLGLGYLIKARTDLKIAHNNKDTVKLFYYAESALQHSMAELLNGSDPDGDGMGNIPIKDVDGDGLTDYYAGYSAGTGMITANGQFNSGATLKTVQAKVIPRQFTGAMQVGQNIIASTGNAGIISGNVTVKTGTIGISPTLVGGDRKVDASLVIPSVSFAGYQGMSNFQYASNQTWIGQPPNGNGIYYINGNLTIAGVSNFNLQGTIVVTGTLTANSCLNAFTIHPTGKNPAIVAGGNISMTGVSGEHLDIQGVVYSGQGIYISNFVTGPNIINGALVAVTDLNIMTTNGDQFIFDSSVNPPFFTGSTGIKFGYWKGNQ